MPERLQSIELNIESGVFRVNGKDIPLSNVTDVTIKCVGGYVEIETSIHLLSDLALYCGD